MRTTRTTSIATPRQHGGHPSARPTLADEYSGYRSHPNETARIIIHGGEKRRITSSGGTETDQHLGYSPTRDPAPTGSSMHETRLEGDGKGRGVAGPETVVCPSTPLISPEAAVLRVAACAPEQVRRVCSLLVIRPGMVL